MYNASDIFDSRIKESSRTFRARITVDGEIIESIKSMTINTGSCGSDAFSFGVVFASYINVVLPMTDIVIAGREMYVELGLVLPNGTVEYIPMGYFLPSLADLSKNDDQITVKASDRINSKCGFLYTPSVTFPVTIGSVIADLETQAGIEIETALPVTGVIEKEMTGLVARDALGYIAGLLGGFCWCDRTGKIQISAFPTLSARDVSSSVTFNLETMDDYQLTTVIVEVSASGTDADGNDVEGESYVAGDGTDERLTVSNPYMTQALFNAMSARILDYTYIPGTISFLGDPRIDPTDAITAYGCDGSSYFIPCMSITQEYDGGVTTTITAPGRASSDSALQGPLSQQVDNLMTEIVLAKQVLANKVSADEIAAKYATIDNLNTVQANITTLSGDLASYKTVVAGNFSAANAEITKVSGDLADYKTVVAGQISAVNADISSVSGNLASFKTGEFAALNADFASFKSATIEHFTAVDMTIEELSAGQITVEYLDANYASIDLANIEAGCITTAMIATGAIGTAQIADGSITDAKIVGLTANKITAGILDAATIEVINLNAANITVGTINGQQIASGAIDVTKLSASLNATITDTVEDVEQALADAGLAISKADSAAIAASAAQAAANSAVSAANAAQATANGKNTVFYQTSAPSTSGRKVNDIWYDTDDGYRMYYFNGTAWTATQFGAGAIGDNIITSDKIAADVNSKITQAFDNAGLAITTANSASSTANTAKSTADTAKSTADTAKSTADRALTKANAAASAASTAQTTADGKNTVFYQTSVPSTSGRKVNDVWFDTDDGNKMYYWSGSAWTAKQFGTSAIANLAVTNALIADATIQSAKIANLDAAKITSGYISVARLQAGTITADKLKASTITAASGVIANAAILTANIADLAVSSGKIADAAIGTAKIADLAVTNAKLANLSVTNAKIADATISSAKIASLDAGKITTGTLSADRIAAGSLTIGKLDGSTQNLINYASVMAIASMSGKLVYKDTQFAAGTNGVSYYNNNQSNSATVTATRQSKQSDSPSSSGYEIAVKITGAGSPGLGGFVQTITSRASAHFIIKYIIKLPVGYYLVTASNNMGTGYTDRFITSTAGTGKYTEYVREVICGTTGTFSNGGHVYVQRSTGNVPTASSPLTMYLAGIWQYDITGMERDIDSVISAWCYNSNTTYINGGKIYTGTITASQIAASAVTAEKIASNAVIAAKISAGAVTSDKLAANSVIAGKIAANAVTAGTIAASAVTSDKIAASAITTDKLNALAVTTEKLAANAVTAAKIAAATITATQLASNAVTAAKISAGAITTDKLAAQAVTAAKINVADLFAQNITATGTITGVKIKGAYGEFTSGFNVSIPVAINSKNQRFYIKADGTSARIGIEPATDDGEIRTAALTFEPYAATLSTSGALSIKGQSISIASNPGGIVLSSGSNVAISGCADISGDLLPTSTNAYDLGSSSLRWLQCHAMTFYEAGTALSSKYNPLINPTYGTPSADISFPSGTWTVIAKLSLKPGKYLLIGGITWNSNTTGARACGWHDAVASPGRWGTEMYANVSGETIRMQSTRMVTMTATKTWYFLGYQRGGSTLSTEYAYWYIIPFN